MASPIKTRPGSRLGPSGSPDTNPLRRSPAHAETVPAADYPTAERVGVSAEYSPSTTPDYADLFERAPVGYMLLDASGCIERINHTGAALLGWTPSWLVGKPFSRWVVNNDKQLFHVHQHKLLTCGHCTSQELRVKNRQGRMVSLRLESMRESDTHETSYAKGAARCRSIMIDVSGEQQSARKLRRLQSQLTHVARLSTAGELTCCLAHELNQPLGTVVLNCEAALRMLLAGNAQEYDLIEALTQTREAASFASDVVRHLRSFLRGNGELHTVCELRALILDVSTLIEADARDSDIELQLDIEQRLPPVRVDCVQIEQVLLNLAHNSIEAMRDGGGGPNRVTIRAYQDPPEQIRVSVTDTGPGLGVEHHDRLFTPFYTTKRDGMGMGLSISRTIIETHGGELWADIDSGNGATFVFTLPTIVSESHAD